MHDSYGLLKYSELQVPATISEWGTTIWIEVISQCQNTGECNEGKAHWWKFEKSLTYTEAFWFVISHKNPSSSEVTKVAGTPVELKYMGEVSCKPEEEYGCAREHYNG